jgi:hypothetical protein
MEWREFLSLFALPFEGTIDWEANLYIGICLLAPGLLGLITRSGRDLRGVWTVIILGFLISIGKRNPLFDLFYYGLPGFSSFRIHARAALLISFGILLAAGAFLSRPPRILRDFWSANMPFATPYCFAAICVIQALNLAVMNFEIKRSYGPPGGSLPDIPFERTLVSALDETNLFSASPAPPRVRAPQLPPNMAMVDRFSNPDAYTSLFLKRPWESIHTLLDQPPSAVYNTSLPLEFYTRAPSSLEQLSLNAELSLASNSLNLITNPLPRAFVVYAARVCTNLRELLSEMKQGVDLQKHALVEKHFAVSLPRHSDLPMDRARFLSFAHGEMTIEANVKTNGILVVAEAWYPGWAMESAHGLVASVPVNAWMRGFPVTPGSQTFHIRYHQHYLVSGGIISSVSLGAVVVAIVGKRRTRCDDGNRGDGLVPS